MCEVSQTHIDGKRNTPKLINRAKVGRSRPAGILGALHGLSGGVSAVLSARFSPDRGEGSISKARICPLGALCRSEDNLGGRAADVRAA